MASKPSLLSPPTGDSYTVDLAGQASEEPLGDGETQIDVRQATTIFRTAGILGTGCNQESLTRVEFKVQRRLEHSRKVGQVSLGWLDDRGGVIEVLVGSLWFQGTVPSARRFLVKGDFHELRITLKSRSMIILTDRRNTNSRQLA